MYTDNLPEKLSVVIVACSFMFTHLCYQRISMSQHTISKIVLGFMSLLFLLIFIESGTALWLKNIRQDYLQKLMFIVARIIQVTLIFRGIVISIMLIIKNTKRNKESHMHQKTAT